MAGTQGRQLADGLLEPQPEAKKRKVDTSEEKQQAAGGAIIGTAPLPLRCPPYPKSGKRKDVAMWNRECRRISALAAAARKKDPRTSLPTVVKPKDPKTAGSVESPRDKALVRDAARSVVSVSSFAPDGSVIMECSGFVVGWNATSKCARILTSTLIMDIYDDPKPPKLHVLLPNKTILDGQLLFFNKHYGIALLEVHSSESDLPLHVPSFGSSPNYGQEVFVLARGPEESNLMARHGRIRWLEQPEDLDMNYLMLLSCEPPMYSTGGPVVDHDDGRVVGMYSLGGLSCTVFSITTILTCVQMWINFGRIARPAHGLRLRTMELLDVSLQERIFLDHGITRGYIVNHVPAESAAERLGIREGDVIVSFNELCDHTLPQLEDYLLSLGWGFLHRSVGSSPSSVDLKLEVYDLLERTTRSITLPVEFSDGYDWD
ncbi:uncharacterized protein [Lolium perenne]|uniref:uncharacterized protein n=1 Tax=Lolium perenne TaxID=4522 RepID=UPI0021F6688A|nr:uncharacterized protein LOC127328445 [Lolium perenne]